MFLRILEVTHSTLTVHHHIHTRQLRPDLSEHANVRAVDVLRVEQFPVGDVGKLCFERTSCLDVFQLVLNEWAIGITLAVNQSQDSVALFPSVLASEPARRLWHEDHEAEQENGGQHLDAPSEIESQLTVQIYHEPGRFGLRNAENGFAIVVGILVRSANERSSV